MVRHGQYNLDGTQDTERYLTELGRKQAEVTGQRLGLLYSDYLQKTDENGNEIKDGTIKVMDLKKLGLQSKIVLFSIT